LKKYHIKNQKMCEETSIRNKAYGIKERIEKASDMNIE